MADVRHTAASRAKRNAARRLAVAAERAGYTDAEIGELFDVDAAGLVHLTSGRAIPLAEFAAGYRSLELCYNGDI